MIVDQLAYFSDAQTFTTGSASGVTSDKSIDLGTAGLNIGTGKDLYVVVVVTTAMAGTNPNATKIEVITDSAATLVSAPVVLQTLESLPTNSVAGTKVVGKLASFGATATKRYLGLKYTSDNTLSACVLSAFLVEGAQLDAVYAQSTGAAIPNS